MGKNGAVFGVNREWTRITANFIGGALPRLDRGTTGSCRQTVKNGQKRGKTRKNGEKNEEKRGKMGEMGGERLFLTVFGGKQPHGLTRTHTD
jgi:hypothetical protein